jgi:peptidoglycan/LPS O-acetylase OafA/YrhL
VSAVPPPEPGPAEAAEPAGASGAARDAGAAGAADAHGSAPSGPGRRARPRLEQRALIPGTAVGVLSIAAAVLASRLSGAAADDDRAFLILPLVELAIVGLVSGGWLAALRCRRAPLVHGAVAALGAVVLGCVASMASHLAGGDAVPWAAVAVWLLLALAAGTAGGLVSLRPQPTRRRGSP